ncbi:hypothetical protein GCM10008023_05980 [Sphingomonas glacialis]|uniref:Uncharacterized protein n=1 Tax=Sphingomonas glacialis TaxID=658225 RepID=A0ABQ3L9C5_9SPHN|nr:hypothetical protein [Sphingomonas glacialis]GHH09374.1 hypothetical protein GCM10008023_05980 [Sphingomonas glacialis]
MADAGLEGGSIRRIEADWTLNDVAAWRASWKRNGPPLRIAAINIAAALGIDLLKSKSDDMPLGELDVAPNAVSLTDIHQVIELPISGGDTMAASRAIAERFAKGK